MARIWHFGHFDIENRQDPLLQESAGRSGQGGDSHEVGACLCGIAVCISAARNVCQSLSNN